jgi:lipid II:glycine glycyltransferase (peptidoglycan interpeptide bridge formation enzyme)
VIIDKILMNIIYINDIKNTYRYPYFYLKGYVSFIKETEKKDIVFFADKIDNTMPCKIWKNKFLNYIQPIYPPLNKDGDRLPKDIEKTFIEDFVKVIKQNKKYDRISVADNFSISHVVPKNSIYCKFGTYYIDIEKQPENDLFKNLHVKHRNVIRNAERNNIIVKYGKEYINDFYLLYQQTMKRSKMYCEPISYFNQFYNSLPENIICGVAYYNNIPQGALFMPYSKFGAFYLYGASTEKIEVNGAINYLHWRTIQTMRDTNIKRYDFVGARLSDVSGTKLYGIQQFKERFGSKLDTGYLWKIDLNTNKCRLYDTMLHIKTKLKRTPLPLDIIDQENNN